MNKNLCGKGKKLDELNDRNAKDDYDKTENHSDNSLRLQNRPCLASASYSVKNGHALNMRTCTCL